jgi:cytochrome P450
MTEAPAAPAFPFDGGCPRLQLHPYYHWLRQNEPVTSVVMPSGGNAWVVTRYEDVRYVLLRQDLFSRAAAEGLPGYPVLKDFILGVDGEDHSRIRKIANHAFTPRRVEALLPQIENIAGELLDRMAGRAGQVDLVADYALPLTLNTIGDLLGVPAADRDRFTHWGNAFLSTSTYSQEDAAEAQQNMAMYLAGLVAQRRDAPSDDLISEIVRASDDDGGVLAEHEMLYLIIAILVGGFETSSGQIASSALHLATHPDHIAYLRAHPERTPAAVEQLLQHLPVSVDEVMPRRYVGGEDLELGGAVIREGDVLLPSHTSANFDETAFPGMAGVDFTKDPDPQKPHLSFGWGPHFCLGASLARVEVQIAIGALVHRFPEFRLAIPEGELRWKANGSVRGLLELPVLTGGD